MRTFDQYFPVRQEVTGRFFVFEKISVLCAVLVFLLACSAGYFPTYFKEKEVRAKLDRYLQDSYSIRDRTANKLDGILDLIKNKNINTGFIGTLTKKKEDLYIITSSMSPDNIIAEAEEKQELYDEAQRLIKNSKYKDYRRESVPRTAEGKEYLNAKNINPPLRFNYIILEENEQIVLQKREQLISIEKYVDGLLID